MGAQGTDQAGDGQLAVLVDADIEDVAQVGLILQPGAPVGDDGGGIGVVVGLVLVVGIVHAGQYGDCWLRVEPLIGPDGTSDGYEFVDEVVGGRIPRSLIPAVDKGVQETMKDGIIAGYPLTGIRVAVYDGSYHSVDSNEMAFRAAARIGLRKACADADPVVLEPIEEITVTIPESYAGAVMGDISASRGRVTGMETDERGDTVVIAQAPLAELTDYSTRLRSITRGTGDFTMKPAGYEQVPYDVQAKLVERYEEGRAK